MTIAIRDDIKNEAMAASLRKAQKDGLEAGGRGMKVLGVGAYSAALFSALGIVGATSAATLSLVDRGVRPLLDHLVTVDPNYRNVWNTARLFIFEIPVILTTLRLGADLAVRSFESLESVGDKCLNSSKEYFELARDIGKD